MTRERQGYAPVKRAACRDRRPEERIDRECCTSSPTYQQSPEQGLNPTRTSIHTVNAMTPSTHATRGTRSNSGPAAAPPRQRSSVLPFVSVVARDTRWTRWALSYGVSSVAQGMPVVIVISILDEAGASPAWVAVAAGARLVPYVVCSPVAGALAARVAMGTVCRATCACRLGVLCALTLLVNTALHPLVLAAFLFALTTAGTPVYPALVAATRAVVPHGRLARANAITAAVESAAFVAGPALAGLLLGTAGRRGVMVTACVLMSMALLVADRGPVRSSARTTLSKPERLRTSVSSAARALCRRSARPGVTSLLAVNLLAGLEAVLLVTVADRLRDAGTAAYGTLAAASGAGAMCGVAIALVGSSRRRLPEAPPVFVVVSALSLAGLALVGNVAVAAIVVGVAGAACMLAEISALGRLQRCVAAHDLAPAFGVLDSVSVLAMLAGAADRAGGDRDDRRPTRPPTDRDGGRLGSAAHPNTRRIDASDPS